MGTQSEQLERKAHQVRARLTETLEELRAGMTPGQVVAQFADYARKGPAAEFFRNLAQEMAGKPAPAHADWSWDHMADHSEQSIVTRSRQALYSKGGR
jgi:hypothetical protein